MNERIDTLLELYYKGETTLAQEQELRDFLTGSHAGPGYDADREVFLAMSSVETPDTMLPRLNAAIDNLDKSEKSRPLLLRPFVRIAISVAACVAVIVTLLIPGRMNDVDEDCDQQLSDEAVVNYTMMAFNLMMQSTQVADQQVSNLSNLLVRGDLHRSATTETLSL